MNNSLAEVRPELVPEWSEKNLPLKPDEITFGSNKKVWWRRSKLPIDFIDKNDEEYFLNRRGAKVYFDITKQPVLEIAEGSQTEMVLSVGMDKLGIPLITISNDGNPICYRLPEELSDWTYTAIGMANMGENLFPSQVVFTKEKNRYFADIL